MAIPLKQSTASQEILLGPFLDDTDGKTPETALSIANTDIKLWFAGGTSESSKNSGGATHIASGRYYATLDATDTATLGPMEINVHVTGALPVRRECLVMTSAAYDALVGTTAPLTVAGIADGVWDEATAGHSTAGTTGKALTDASGAGSPPSAASIADAVWDEARSGHVAGGSFGESVVLSAAERNAAADALLNRATSSITESAAPKKSLYAAIAKLTHKVDSAGGVLTVTRSDDATTHFTQTETNDAAADPLIGLGGAA